MHSACFVGDKLHLCCPAEVPGSGCGISNFDYTGKSLADVVLEELMAAIAQEKPGQCGTKLCRIFESIA